MNPNLLFIIMAVLLAIGIYISRLRLKTRNARLGLSETKPSRKEFPVYPKQNDKLVVIKAAGYADLKKVLTDFCKMYNRDGYQVKLKVTKLSEIEFAITFPYDIDFEIYCYFINYLVYPVDIDFKADVIGWATTKADDIWMTETTVNKKAMLFVPADDTEGDNVFLTTSDNIGYKIGFSQEEESRELNTPKKIFVQPDIDIGELAGMEYEDFK